MVGPVMTPYTGKWNEGQWALSEHVYREYPCRKCGCVLIVIAEMVSFHWRLETHKCRCGKRVLIRIPDHGICEIQTAYDEAGKYVRKGWFKKI